MSDADELVEVESAPADDAGVTLDVRKPKLKTWVVIALSTYPEDLEALDQAVALLRAAGMRRINRSRLIRIALRKLDLSLVIEDVNHLR